MNNDANPLAPLNTPFWVHLVPFAIPLILLLATIFILLISLDCINNKTLTFSTKLKWLFVILLMQPLLGACLYFLFEQSQRKQLSR